MAKKKKGSKGFTLDDRLPRYRVPRWLQDEWRKENEQSQKKSQEGVSKKRLESRKEKNLKFVNGRWYVDFTFNKKRIRRFGGYTKEQARNTLAKLRLEKLDERLGFKKPEKPDVPFDEFSKEFIELHSKLHKRSWKRDEASLKNLKPFFKGKMLGEIGPELVENYKAKRKAATTRRKTHITEATINREIALLKTMFSKAVEWGRIENNPLSKVKKFRENHQKHMRILSDEEAITLVDAANSHLKPILIIALNTGMRRGEILALRWENVDFHKGLILIGDSKSGKSREVPMSHLVYETLKDLQKSSEYVFFNPGTATHILNVKTSFKSACRRANIKGLRFHDLRHTAASRMIQAGVDLVTVSKILGHSSIQMTMRYVHSTTELMKQAVEKLAEIYEQTRQKVDTPTEEVAIKRPVKRLNTDN